MALFRELGRREGVASTLADLGTVAYREGRLEAAGDAYREALTLSQELASDTDIARCLKGLASVAEAQGHAPQSVRLLAAAAAAADASGAPLSSSEQADEDRLEAALRATLGEAVFAAAWAEGRAMTSEQAIDYTREP